ncbi:MAG: hypothetical protein M1812_001429 [Candelaria pacifica]|nr:MAG: hypothetical protein M1812_001429 [Candelaria pacifica]
MAQSLNPTNYSIYAIPATYGLAVMPMVYAFSTMMRASNYQWSNAAPRQNFEALKGKVPQETWDKCFRAYGAHLNGLESFPLFAAAVLAGNLAKLPASEMNSFAAQYIGFRILYSGLYIFNRSSEKLAYVRTGVWYWSLALPVLTLIHAGNKLSL